MTITPQTSNRDMYGGMYKALTYKKVTNILKLDHEFLDIIFFDISDLVQSSTMSYPEIQSNICLNSINLMNACATNKFPRRFDQQLYIYHYIKRIIYYIFGYDGGL